MKRHGFVSLSCLALAALLVSSCASGPAPVPEAPKVRKERTVPVDVPVLVKETSFFADGAVDEYIVYKYDAAFLILLGKDSYDVSRPDPVERMVAEVEGGRVKAESTYGADGKLRFRRELSWDQAGRLAGERSLDAKGAVQSSSTYAYDAAGNRSEWRAFDGQGILKAVTTYGYADGRLVLIDMKDGAGARTGSIAVEYDAAGLMVKRSYRAPDGSLQKYESFVYVGARLAALETHRADGFLVSKTAYAYGELGQVLAAVTTDASGAVKDRRAFDYSIRQDQKTEVYWE